MLVGVVYHRRVILPIIVLLLQYQSDAQLTAAFSATPTSGCTPIVVQFTDQSTGSPTQWKWDLGNGVISFLQNPSTTYFTPGSYTIKLVVKNANGADSVIRNQYINVFPAPAVNFMASDTVGCVPLPVQFTDQSGGSIASWSWDFGDGTTSSQSNPLHIYNTPGNFTVALRVTTTNGCVKIFSRPQYIEVSNGVDAEFTNTYPSQCSVPVTINFINTSSGPGTLNYTWNFGDGSGSNLANPVHTYSTPGTYTVTLVVESSFGCRDTLVRPNLITTGNVSSHFNSPDSICVNQSFAITNSSTPSPTASYWDFGDGTTSSDINPVKTYTTPGTFIIKLVNVFSGCTDSTTKPIIVRPAPTPDFSVNPTQSCRVPFTTNFTNLTPGNNNYIWYFGDGGTSTAQNPVHTYTVEGTYSVTLIATNGIGCSDTIVKPDIINIKQPLITLNGLPASGCIPFTISPGSTLISSEPVTTYLWNFGDGTTSNLPNPVHTYTAVGTYTVSLTITTASGCTASTVMNAAVMVGNHPHAEFAVQPSPACAIEPVHFTDNSTGGPDHWQWSFGDGSTSSDQNPVHVYEDTGHLTVTLIVWSNGCPDTVSHVVIIKPPVASFVFHNNCGNKYRVDFVDNSIGALTWSWNFGDGTTSTLQSPSHTYSSPGTYTVNLVVTNGNCTYNTIHTVRIIDEKALFNTDNSAACKNTLVHFTSININPGNIISWHWDFGDGDTTNNALSTSHVFTGAGTYIVTLTITDVLGCADSHSLPVTIFGPHADFSPSVPAICFGNGPVSFNDLSTGDGSHPIVKWVWNYGDGTIDSISAPPYQHNYLVSGDFTVSLTVADNLGCRDSIRKTSAIIIAHPHAAFHTNDSMSCTDRPINFINESTGHDLHYVWDFGDGSSSTSTSPVHYYGAVGIYNVTLYVTDQFGCKDSLARNAYINISFPRAGFTVSDSFTTCPPLQVSFTNLSANYTTLRWDFGDGNNSSLANPSHVYTYPGTYTATVVVTGPGGCKDSTSKTIEVRGPRGTFTYGPLQGCKPLTVTFAATTIDRLSFLWDFGDGTTLATTDSMLSHIYSFPGIFVPRMILEDVTGCRVPIPGTDTLRVVGVQAKFGLTQSGSCGSAYVSFHDSTMTNDALASWHWDFGDGTTSAEQNPGHIYTSPGVYIVSLTVTTSFGCTDSYTLSDSIKIFPNPSIAINGDTTACVPAQLTFSGEVLAGNSALLQWIWNLGNGNSSTLSNPPAQLYSTAGTFNVSTIVTDEHGCKDTVTKTVTIHPLPPTDAGPNVAVCLGNTAQLHASGASTYVWNALPDLSCTNCADPTISPTDQTTYVVTGTSEFGCVKKDSVTVNVQKPFVLTISPNDTICLGESTKLLASGADQYLWYPSATLDNANSASPTASPTSNTFYTVTAQDSLHCFTKFATVTVLVYPIPTVEAGPDHTIVIGNTVPLHATNSADVISWRWRPANGLSCNNCPDPVASPTITTQYTLEVRNQGGCVSKDMLTIYVNCNNGALFIPNTFSPNGDGMNDRFYVRARGTFIIRSLRIFNRWGELVFEKLNCNPNDASAGWDGKYKGKILSPDVFVYTCVIQCENNETLTYTGDVTLIQ